MDQREESNCRTNSESFQGSSQGECQEIIVNDNERAHDSEISLATPMTEISTEIALNRTDEDP